VSLATALIALATSVSAQQLRFDDVVRNLRNPDPKTRAAAVRLLREAKYPEAIVPLAALVLDPIRSTISSSTRSMRSCPSSCPART